MTTFDACLAQLEALIEIENAALARMDVGAIAALTAEKNRLVSVIRELALEPIDQETGLRRARRLHGLSEPATTNKILLERAMLVHRRLMAIVASAAAPKALGYARSGNVAGQHRVQPHALVAKA